MSQSILQNGYAILLSNTSDLDNQLLAKDKLLRRLKEIKADKEASRDTAIQSRVDQINKLDTYIGKLLLAGTDQDSIDKYTNLKVQLENQVAQIRAQNLNASYDDVRETHAFFINTTFKPLVSVAYGYSVANTTPLPLFGSSTRIQIPIYGDFVLDQALHVRLSSLKATHKENKIRWYDFIGHRIIKEVRLVCDGTILDRYGCEEMEMYYRFHVSENQKYGWQRCVGQETPTMGVFLQDPTNQEVRERKLIYDGLQTPKREHDAYDLYIPLLFWFNTDPAFAISNWNITYNKFWIEVEFEDVDNCIQIIDYAGDGGIFEYPQIEACDLITNHVYTTPEVAELFKHQSQFSIIRVHKRVERIVNKKFDNVNISDIKFAVENLYVRFRPLSNERDANACEIWRNNDVSTYKELRCASIIQTAGITSLAYTPTYYYQTTPAVDSIALISDGNTIYDVNPGVFYNSYIPLRFGGERIMTPADEGAYLMTFSIYPGEAQPSGYLNFSQSREQYIAYQSSYVDNDHPVSLMVCATCINFLVLMPGALSIRYAT
jgi:Major capsid protein N-terminus/Large eukaryotic DNA virus major capsid protein